jgi:hypothetical protein
MSRKPKPALSLAAESPKAPKGKWIPSGDGFDFVRGRNPDVMWSLFQQITPRRAVLSWLTPGKPLFGLPYHFDGLPWLTIVDDLDPAAAGPDSFDGYSLEWWATRAGPIAIDAATPTVSLYEPLGALAAAGHLVLIIQTVKERRLRWHQYFVSVRPSARQPDDDDASHEKPAAHWPKANYPNRWITRRFRIRPTYFNQFGHALMPPRRNRATPQAKFS